MSVLTAGIQEKSSNETRVPQTQEVEEGRAGEGGAVEENGRQTKKRRIMDRDDWVAEQRLIGEEIDGFLAVSRLHLKLPLGNLASLMDCPGRCFLRVASS